MSTEDPSKVVTIKANVSVTQYPVTAEDDVMLADCTNGSLTFVLPTPSGTLGSTYYFKKIDSSSNAMVIQGPSGSLINGLSNISATTQGATVSIITDGSNFQTIVGNSSGGASGVSSLNTLTGAVVLAAGSNITLTPSGNTVTIAASGGGSVTPHNFTATLSGGTNSNPSMWQVVGASGSTWTEQTDTDSTFNGSTGVYTVPTTGLWSIAVALGFAAGQGTYSVGMRLNVNGTAYSGQFFNGVGSASFQTVASAPWLLQLDAGTPIWIEVFQNQGSSFAYDSSGDLSTFSAALIP